MSVTAVKLCDDRVANVTVTCDAGDVTFVKLSVVKCKFRQLDGASIEFADGDVLMFKIVVHVSGHNGQLFIFWGNYSFFKLGSTFTLEILDSYLLNAKTVSLRNWSKITDRLQTYF